MTVATTPWPWYENIEISRVEIDAIDFKRGEAALLELAGYFAALDPPLRAAKKIARDDMRERFESQIAPDGTQWRDLDPDYAVKKEHEVGFIYPILTKTGDLKEKALSEEAWSITGESIFYSTASLPDYWEVHQYGSDDYGTMFHGGNIDETGHLDSGEGGSNIPPRPFIGLSDEAEAKIFEVFDIWFSTGLEEASHNFFVSSQGVLQTRGIGGKFGKRIDI
jgi:phage gpG-like protein